MEKLVVIAGTNASGKSGLGIELAKHYGAEIISADSRQVYEGLDLGSGKVTKEEMQGVPHHLLDVAKVNSFFSLKNFQSLCYGEIDDCLRRKVKPFLVGGTGLYINAVVDGYNLSVAPPEDKLRREIEEKTTEELIELIKSKNPEVLEKVDTLNKRRLERAAEKVVMGVQPEGESEARYETLVLGVTWPREILYKRIEERLDKRLEQGMIEEVEHLITNGATDDFLYRLGLEYRYILLYLRGNFTSKEAFREKLFMEIRHLAKEQMTWFRKRKDICWLDMTTDPFDQAVRMIDGFYGN